MKKPDLEKRVAAIEARNQRVELDKAWEVSWTRKLVLFCITFLLTFLFLLLIRDDRAWGNAVLAAIGILLSTLTISYLKTWWISRQ